MRTVLVVDADGILGRALCAELAAAGFGVLAHARTPVSGPFPAGVVPVTAARLSEAFAVRDGASASVGHVVFDQPPGGADFPDDDGLQAVTASVEEDLMGFLDDLQAAGRLLARRGGAQLWVLTHEDSIGYYTGQPSLPILARARQAAVKSLAKEVFRFGVRVNCASVQTLAEQATAQEWQRARDGLKAFAMKFKPVGARAVAGTLRRFLEQPDLPISGMIVPIGVGFAENNI
jgi:NAD(P)-dependent dehydrogenase (short-subunit alcohol dehydrogenase family)